jgi:hypothetical protein
MQALYQEHSDMLDLKVGRIGWYDEVDAWPEWILGWDWASTD